jgi:type II secretory pathway pseudopilin PulG
MVVLWLIEFLLVALIVVVLLLLGQKVIAHYRSRAAAQTLAQELMRFEEAKTIVLQHANRQVRRGVPFEQAVLFVLSDKYWPESEPGSAEISMD